MQRFLRKRSTRAHSLAFVLALLLLCRMTASAGKEFAMPDAHAARTYPAHDEHPQEKVTIAVDPYDVEYKASIFSVNYRNYGLMPVFFVVTNDSDQPIALTEMKAELVTEYGVPESKATVIPFGLNSTVPDTTLTPEGARQRLKLGAKEKVLLFFGNIVRDAAAMEEVFRASQLDWTIVRPPRLTDKAYTGRYRVREGHLPHFGFTVSRADVADFMVRQAIDSNSVGKIFGVSN